MFLFLIVFKTWQAWSCGAVLLESGHREVINVLLCWSVQAAAGRWWPLSQGSTNYKTGKRIQQPGARIVCLSNGALQFAEHHLKMRLDTLIPAVVGIASIY